MSLNRYYIKSKHAQPAPRYKMQKQGYYFTFDCLVCGQEHFNAEPAKKCCWLYKPVGNPQAVIDSLAILAASKRYRPRKRLKKRPGEGTKVADRYGHWHRGKKPSPARLRKDYFKAWQKIDADHQVEVVQKLEALYPTPMPIHTPTELQRMAYGYYKRNWQAIRNAAENIAETAAIEERLRHEKKPPLPPEIEELLRIKSWNKETE